MIYVFDRVNLSLFERDMLARSKSGKGTMPLSWMHANAKVNC